jgi:hypothetical protein
MIPERGIPRLKNYNLIGYFELSFFGLNKERPLNLKHGYEFVEFYWHFLKVPH